MSLDLSSRLLILSGEPGEIFMEGWFCILLMPVSFLPLDSLAVVFTKSFIEGIGFTGAPTDFYK